MLKPEPARRAATRAHNPRSTLGLIAVLVPLLAGCSMLEGEPDTPDKRSIRLALNWYPEPEFGGFYEAVLGGHYERAGFDVEIVPGGPGAPTLQLLGAGRADVAITAADDLLIQRNKGAKALGIWATFQNTPMGIMVRKDSGIQNLRELPGLVDPKIAIEVGSPFQTFLWKSGGWAGKVSPVPYGGSVGPFLAGAVTGQQAYITSEPCVARQGGVDVEFLEARQMGWNPYGTLLAVADPAPEWAAEFVHATQAGWKAYLTSPDRANAHIASLNEQLTPELVDCITAAQRPFVLGGEGLGAMSEDRWEDMARQLVSIGLLSEGARAEGAWAEPWMGAP